MTFEYKIEPPYPLEAKVVLSNGNTLTAHIIYLEGRGCIVEMSAPFLKTGDKVTADFNLGTNVFKESSVIVKIYIQFKDGKPHYMSELHFKKPTDEKTKIIETFVHEAKTKKVDTATAQSKPNPEKK